MSAAAPSGFPLVRPRRLRGHPTLRRMVRENHLCVEDLIAPLFVTEGSGLCQPVESMPEVYRFSIDELVRECTDLEQLGVPAVILFGVPLQKDLQGHHAVDAQGLIPRAIRAIKAQCSRLLVISDVCLCEWLSHGHCGLVQGDLIVNDETLSVLSAMALAHAQAGVDLVAPSDMMDGRVQAIRRALDAGGFTNLPLMAYSAKYASGFYAPFREAGGGAPQFGDRASYQMDIGNRREALREALLDIAEGADILMVKPALAYLDVLADVRAHTELPLAAYNVSGEYAMIWAAHRQGWLDVDRIAMETLLCMKRAGADLILSYFAKRVARILNKKL